MAVSKLPRRANTVRGGSDRIQRYLQTKILSGPTKKFLQPNNQDATRLHLTLETAKLLPRPTIHIRSSSTTKRENVEFLPRLAVCDREPPL